MGAADLAHSEFGHRGTLVSAAAAKPEGYRFLLIVQSIK
ncbi:hypothetical protein C7S16_7048 [Burkholderia thailandensis]|uniref:Uncharacterized protein n=1 Tax=Burkholderia thailandensis TaxID=57975 RepID=A0AAW9CXA8_BURTH|nr:hypothetical protein [Burkholderia thailandensis]